ncbi:BamA/TamA family outer membrane protein [Ferrimonas gelatinilytica]|uniref:BamA/TamA family outer membrane protein n=2 Tax=Ferrimonas gelatinilytica TaxID=1255257 RepID=A0ABP9RZY3_9GAMM
MVSQVQAVSFIDPLDGQFDMGEYLAENAYGFLPVPVIITEPAVGYGGGLIGVFLHESAEEKARRKTMARQSTDGGAQLIPPAVTAVGGGGTENGTWFALGGHRRTWREDGIRYQGFGGYANAVIDIYNDLGGLLPGAGFAIQTDSQGYFIVQDVQFRLPDTNWFLGFAQTYAHFEVSSDNPLADRVLKLLLGESTGTSALGVMAEYDSRNSFFFPTKGYSLDFKYMFYRDFFGSDYDYDTLDLIGQAYFPVTEKWTWALKGAYQSLNSDEVGLPPLVRPYIDLRGIPSFRYQGDYVSAIQTQIMWQVAPRWTLSGFVGVGSAESEFDDLYGEGEWAYGAGFRYQVARRYGLHMGMDFGFSDEDSAFYITVGTGF